MIKQKATHSKEFLYYIATTGLCIIFLYVVLRLWSADLTIPFVYGGDAVGNQVAIKGMLDNGWYTANPFIGAPTVYFSYDTPANDHLNMLIMKMISFVFPDSAVTLNLYFLLTFPLTAITTLFAFRKMKVFPLPAVVGSLLFTFIPYHFLRGEAHLVLSAYFLIPLMMLVVMWVFEDDFLLNQFKKPSITSLLPVVSWKNLFSIIVCISVAATFFYYPFFSCFFLLVAGFCASISQNRWMPLMNCFLLIGIIVLCIVVYNIPTLLYQWENGRNMAVVMRSAGESEIYGLKIIQLLLPTPGHRIPLFGAIAQKYANTAPQVNENSFAALGIIGSIGFIFLIVFIFYKLFNKHPMNNNNETWQKLTRISTLNMAALLLATIGGFGTIFAYLISPQIRCYNRINIFIAFFSITAVVVLMNLLIQKYSFSKIKKWIIGGCIIAVLLFGLYDQTSEFFVPDYKNTKEEFLSDQHFISNIETRFPEATMVFQLPYIPFPEYPPVYAMGDYSHFRGYLHSTKIHWSYGAIKGREGDLWQQNITSKPMAEMVRGLAFAGFNGIYVDSYGYEDSGKAVLSSLSSLLNETPLVSDNGRLYFFDMTSYDTRLKSQFTPAELEKQKLRTLNILKVEWQGGFSTLEGTQENNWRWCSSQGTLILTNPSDKERTFTITATFLTGHPESSNLNIESSLVTENLKINNAEYNYIKEISIPPGKHAIKFSCDAKRHAPADPRYIVFGTFNFQMIENE